MNPKTCKSLVSFYFKKKKTGIDNRDMCQDNRVTLEIWHLKTARRSLRKHDFFPQHHLDCGLS